MSSPALSSLALDVRKYDRERFVTALFAPEDRREDLLVLYAFNAEVARIKSLIREPLAGAIRLQWWRDVIQGDHPASEVEHHPIAGPLTRLLLSGRLAKDGLLTLLQARERDLSGEPFASLSGLVAYADATAGALAGAALALSGVDDDHSMRAGRGAAIAYALVGMMRSIPAHLAQGWVTIPLDLLDAAGIAPDRLTNKTDLAVPVRQVAAQAADTLAVARRLRVHKSGLSVCLQGTLAHGQLAALKKTGWNPFDSTHAKPQPMPVRLTWHWLRGRF